MASVRIWIMSKTPDRLPREELKEGHIWRDWFNILQTYVTTLFNNTSTTASVGTATLPANPVGFIVVNINGKNYKVPYYNV
jgi:hypothetical protein